MKEDDYYKLLKLLDEPEYETPINFDYRLAHRIIFCLKKNSKKLKILIYLYTPYSLVKSIIAFTFSGFASSITAPLIIM